MDVNLIEPPEGKAVVYVVRPSNKADWAPSRIFCDGKYINMIFPKELCNIIVEPGDHIFYSEIPGRGDVQGLSKLQLHTEPGQIYFLEVKVQVQPPFIPGAWAVNNQLIHIDDSDGRVYLGKCVLAHTVPVNIAYPTTSEELKQFERLENPKKRKK